MIRPTPTVTDPQIIADIIREIEHGTPDTPQRIETIRRADEAFRQLLPKLRKAWGLDDTEI